MSANRVHTILVVALALIGLGTAPAFAKPKVAVLGLEVTGPIDQQTTGIAHDLTEGLRSRARQGNGPYQYAANSDRELIDEKVLKNCDSEGPLCMSDIGKDMGTDYLVYGSLQKQGDGYKARLHVLDVHKKSQEKAMDVSIPGGVSTEATKQLAKKAYTDLVGSSGATGTLTIEANVDAGNVFVDEEQKDALSHGKATLVLPEGRYTVAVESSGKKRKEKTVTIAGGETITEDFELTAPGAGGAKGGGNPWKPAFYVGASVTAGLALLSTFAFLQEYSKKGGIIGAHQDGTSLTDSDCGTGTYENDDPKFASVCTYYRVHKYSAYTAVGTGLISVVFGYMAFVHVHKEPASSAARGSLRSRVAITPLVSPESGGAQLSFEF